MRNISELLKSDFAEDAINDHSNHVQELKAISRDPVLKPYRSVTGVHLSNHDRPPLISEHVFSLAKDLPGQKLIVCDYANRVRYVYRIDFRNHSKDITFLTYLPQGSIHVSDLQGIVPITVFSVKNKRRGETLHMSRIDYLDICVENNLIVKTSAYGPIRPDNFIEPLYSLKDYSIQP